MTTREFKLNGKSLKQFIDFAEGDPYYLDFSEGGQEGTISWETYAVSWRPTSAGFEVSYRNPDDEPIVAHIGNTVQAFDQQQ